MFVSVVSLSHPSSREWYLLYVKCLCLLSRYLIPVVENGMLYVSVCCLLNVKSVICVCVLSRYLSPVVENGICYMLNVCVVVSLSHPISRDWYLLYVKCLCLLSRYLSPVVENGICYMLNVCVCCLVISAQ